MLNEIKAKTIVTTCPHCFHTIGNEYPQFGGNYVVKHHTEFIDELIKAGKLKLEWQWQRFDHLSRSLLSRPAQRHLRRAARSDSGRRREVDRAEPQSQQQFLLRRRRRAVLERRREGERARQHQPLSRTQADRRENGGHRLSVLHAHDHRRNGERGAGSGDGSVGYRRNRRQELAQVKCLRTGVYTIWLVAVMLSGVTACQAEPKVTIATQDGRRSALSLKSPTRRRNAKWACNTGANWQLIAE